MGPCFQAKIVGYCIIHIFTVATLVSFFSGQWSSLTLLRWCIVEVVKLKNCYLQMDKSLLDMEVVIPHLRSWKPRVRWIWKGLSDQSSSAGTWIQHKYYKQSIHSPQVFRLIIKKILIWYLAPESFFLIQCCILFCIFVLHTNFVFDAACVILV